MTITQLSNLFNLIVQNDVDYRFYHYGFPSDMNINISNNYDPLSDTGRLFPYVLLLPPILTSRAMESSTASIFDTYQVEFLITDTYAYEQGVLTYKTDTTIELEQTLQILAKKMIQYLLDYSAVSNPPFNVGDYRIEFDPYRFTADTRSVRVTLDLVVPAICDDQSLDISFLPVDVEDIGSYDYEANLNYCPILNLNEQIIIGTGFVGPQWSAQADPTNFINEIIASPYYQAGLNVITNQFEDGAGNVVGTNTYTGYSLSCDGINTALSDIYYQMEVSANFNTGGGTHNVIFTLTVKIPQPVYSEDYSTNNYICNDIG